MSCYEEVSLIRRRLFSKIFLAQSVSNISIENALEEYEHKIRYLDELLPNEEIKKRELISNIPSNWNYNAIFFVTGNPPHYGHLYTAEEVSYVTKSKVNLFIPNIHHTKKSLPTQENRIKLMERLAINAIGVSIKKPEFEGNRLEGLEYYSQKYSNLAQVIGSDALIQYINVDKKVYSYPIIISIRSIKHLTDFKEIISRFKHIEFLNPKFNLSSTGFRKNFHPISLYPKDMRGEIKKYG